MFDVLYVVFKSPLSGTKSGFVETPRDARLAYKAATITTLWKSTSCRFVLRLQCQGCGLLLNIWNFVSYSRLLYLYRWIVRISGDIILCLVLNVSNVK